MTFFLAVAMASTRNHTSMPVRAAIFGWKATGKSTAEIIDLTGVPKSTINDIYKRARDRGFDPAIRSFKLLDEWLEDAPRAGRPTM